VARLLISGATILDGTGAPGRAGSVLVEGDRIEAVLAPDATPAADRRIDAHGRALAPGFVDTHSHSDLSPLVEPTMDSMLRQGVTTVVVGNCGTAAYPIEGAAEAAALAGADAEAIGADWRTFGDYLDRIDACRPAINVAGLVGHGALRLAAMVDDQRRPPTDGELGAMRALLRSGLEEGAVGMSTGLIYAPGLHADTDELVALAGELASAGGVYASHVRGESDTVFDAVSEAIEIGRRAGVPTHVSHLKVEGRAMWGRSGELLELLDAARADGADVTADQYPYTAWETSLSAALPAWVTAAELPEAASDPATRSRIEQETAFSQSIGWERIAIGTHLPEPGLTGRTVAEVAADRGLGPGPTVVDLLLADPNTGMIGHGMHEDDVRAILARPDVFVGTDGLAVSPSGPLGAYAVHPRYYGTYPRILGRYVRVEGLLSLEDAVRKMTSGSADRFGLAGRGRIEPGALADLVLFDRERVVDAATYERPHAYAEGIDLVVVNGRVAWDGSPGERAGRALRRGVR
jgi:N-acyl-D-aspartate/D-glutamate deacylase